MELKFRSSNTRRNTKVSSNRTFMELKSGKDTDNWHHIDGSNRTFMELK